MGQTFLSFHKQTFFVTQVIIKQIIYFSLYTQQTFFGKKS